MKKALCIVVAVAALGCSQSEERAEAESVAD